MLSDVLHRVILGLPELLLDSVYAVSYRITGNPGLSILLLSLAVSLLLRPLYRRAEALQEEEDVLARRLKPGVDHIRRTFRGDERFMMLQAYYRINRYKPYHALKGALPLLLQVPFFIAAYRFLSGLSLLQGASLGPVADLSRPDGLLVLSGASVNLLPFLMTSVNLASGAVYTRGRSLKNRITVYGTAAVFLVLLYESPSGLVFYWTLNNVFSLVRNLARRKAADRGDPAKEDSALSAEKPADALKPDRHAWGIWFSGCMLLAVLLGLLIPSALVNASPGEFVDPEDFHSPLRFVGDSALISAGTFLLWGTVLFRLSPGRSRRRLAAGAAVLALAAAADYLFFGRGYGNLSPLLKYDNPLSVRPEDVLLNLVVPAASAGLVFLLLKKKPEILKAVCIAACAAMTVMSVLNVLGISAETAELKAAAEQEQEHAKPSFPLSRTGKNVVVIMLDRCISGFVPYILEEHPEITAQLRGFTYYPNTLSFGRNTNVCTPSLYGGYEYRPFELDKRPDTGLPDKQNEALRVLPVLFSENGFEVTVCDPPYAGYLWIPDLSIYDDYPAIHRYNSNGAFLDRTEAIRRKNRTISRNLFCHSLFRAAPVLLQPLLYDEGRYNGSEALNPAGAEGGVSVFSAESPLKSTGISDDFMRAYTALQHLPDMTKVGDAAGAGLPETAEGPQGTFLILSNTATHDVTLLQEPEFEPRQLVDNTDYEAARPVRGASFSRPMELETLAQMEHYQCDTAAFLLLGQWFDFLRENGVWDNTRIIVVSDHGWDLELNHILTGGREERNALAPHDGIMAYNALMMIKDFGGAGEFRSDGTFMTIADTPSEAMRGLIENPVNPFTGNPITQSAKEEDAQYVMLTDWRIAENHGTRFKDPVRLTLRNRYLFDEGNWE